MITPSLWRWLSVKISSYISFFKKYDYLTVFLLILIFWFLLFITSGSLFSGYHFTDDHEIAHINYNFTVENLGIFEVSSQWIHNDLLTGRFRPFYYIHRILETRLLGINWALWSLYTGMLGVLTTFFLFMFGRFINFSIIEALLFSFLITLGAQSAVWWQLGPNETIGTFLLAGALVFAALSERANKYKKIYEGLFIFFVLIMSLSKESFILMIPAIASIKVWISHQMRTLSWPQSLKKNILSLSFLGIFFLTELLLVKFYIGLNPDIGYAGVDGFNISSIINATQSLSQAGYWWLILISLISIRLT
ncbi:hypothetical protein C7B69_19130, partial [filamentous cyanobacterium Phorm 46]